MQYEKLVLSDSNKNKCSIKNVINKLKVNINKKDKFTGLYSRGYFLNCLEGKTNGTLIKIQLKGINFISLYYGKKDEVEVIKLISKNLKNIRDNLLVTRSCQGRFIIYTEQTDINYIKRLIDDIFLISSNIYKEKGNINVSLNIASVIYEYDDLNIENCLNKLEIAMSDAIRKGVNKYQIYNERYETYISIEAIEKAIEEKEITLYYQPKIDTKTGKIKGVEALIRWFHKDYGYIEPPKLIGFAEKYGYINILGKWVVKKACKDIYKLNQLLNHKLDLSVNISPYQLEDECFVEDIKEIVRKVGFDYELLKIEITENEDMESIDKIHDIFEAIKNIGIKVSIDDFGKGFNSIDYIKNYNVDEIKIDKSLVEYLNNNPMFIESLINMIHTTNTSVVAEGVEQKSEYISLKDMGCDLVQGYYCYKPMELEKLLEIIKLNDA